LINDSTSLTTKPAQEETGGYPTVHETKRRVLNKRVGKAVIIYIHRGVF
jgi:hypothetical protein